MWVISLKSPNVDAIINAGKQQCWTIRFAKFHHWFVSEKCKVSESLNLNFWTVTYMNFTALDLKHQTKQKTNDDWKDEIKLKLNKKNINFTILHFSDDVSTVWQPQI